MSEQQFRQLIRDEVQSAVKAESERLSHHLAQHAMGAFQSLANGILPELRTIQENQNELSGLLLSIEKAFRKVRDEAKDDWWKSGADDEESEP